MRGALSPIIISISNENNICQLWSVSISCSSSSSKSFSCVTAVPKVNKLQFQYRLSSIYKYNSIYITTVIKFQQFGVLISEILITNITGLPEGRGNNSDRMFCAIVGICSSVRHSREAPARAGTYSLKFLMWERENGAPRFTVKCPNCNRETKTWVACKSLSNETLF